MPRGILAMAEAVGAAVTETIGAGIIHAGAVGLEWVVVLDRRDSRRRGRRDGLRSLWVDRGPAQGTAVGEGSSRGGSVQDGDAV